MPWVWRDQFTHQLAVRETCDALPTDIRWTTGLEYLIDRIQILKGSKGQRVKEPSYIQSEHVDINGFIGRSEGLDFCQVGFYSSRYLNWK